MYFWLTSLQLVCSFFIEDLALDCEVQQNGAEGSTGFASAHAIQEAIHAGATCVGRTNTPEAALGYVRIKFLCIMHALHALWQGLLGSLVMHAHHISSTISRQSAGAL